MPSGALFCLKIVLKGLGLIFIVKDSMPNNKLILRTLDSPYGDETRGSVLSQADVDNNFIFLKGQDIYTGSTNNNQLILNLVNGSTIEIPFVTSSGGTSGGTGTLSGLTFAGNVLTAKTGTATFTTVIDFFSGITVNGQMRNGDTNTASGAFTHAEGGGTQALGTNSHSEGSSTVAQGFGSHAEGNSTQALGNNSHAEGQATVTSGVSSHAEGFSTQTLNNFSHAEGFFTQALGTAAHAEGWTTIASGDYSHAEGSATTANGSNSHAEGRSSISQGEGSHAEGISTTAIGIGSHSEGNSTQAIGDYSNAGGIGTYSLLSGSSAMGYWNKTGNTESLVVIGNGTSDINRSDLALFNPTGFTLNGQFVITGKTNAVQQTIILPSTQSAFTPFFAVKNSAGVVAMEMRAPIAAGFTSLFIGKNAGGHATNNTSVGIGEDALASITASTSNTAVGFRALSALTTGVSNIAIGHASQTTNFTGSRNLTMGRTSMLNNQNGSDNIVFGDSAMQEATGSTNNNVLIGTKAGGAMSGDTNIAIGLSAMFWQNGTSKLTRPSFQNIAIGASASRQVLLGVNNIAIGTNANVNGTLLDNNILIGTSTDSISAIINTTIIGAGITTNVSNVAILGNGSQNILLGFTTPVSENGARLQVNGNRAFGVLVSGAASLTLTGTAYAHIFTGTTGTWSLPPISGKTGWEFAIKNRGSGILTMNVSDASTTIYSTSAGTSYNINPGEGFVFINDGTYWDLI